MDEHRLKREIGTWGSFAIGYADVGADIYIALGLVALFALGAAPLVLAIAAITYITTGFCYAELASTYPVAGGAQYYSLRAFGPLHGFIAGWGLTLDYTIDIALFALASVGYLGFFEKAVFNSSIILTSPYFGITAIVMIIGLLILNLFGIKYSSRFNEFFVALNLITVGIVLCIGLPLIFINGSISNWFSNLQNIGVTPTWSNFGYAISLAMVSYIGIESISQAAEETKHPKKIIPKATKGAILSVIFLATFLSLLSVTIIPPDIIAGNTQNPMIILSANLPFIGPIFSIWVAFMGFAICYVSTNTGVIGVSRVTFSMGRFNLWPKTFSKLDPKFKTPYITISLFSLLACLLIVFNIFLPGIDLLSLIASLYNFGALIAYMYVNLSLIKLRFKDPTPRTWKVPGNIKIKKNGKQYDLPILPIFGFIACAIVWIIIVGTHEMGRLLGSLWFIIGIIMYFLYKKPSLKKKSGKKSI